MTTDFRILEAPKPVPPGVIADARAFIAATAARWTYAQSVPESPHEYLPREHVREGLREDFDAMVAVVARYGYRGRFLRTTYRYLDVGDRRYWVSPNLYGPGPNLNRAAIVEPDQLGLPGVA